MDFLYVDVHLTVGGTSLIILWALHPGEEIYGGVSAFSVRLSNFLRAKHFSIVE